MPKLDDWRRELALLDVTAQLLEDRAFGCEYCRRLMLVLPVFAAFELDGVAPAPLWLKSRLLSIRAELGLYALVAICSPCRNVHGIGVDFD